MNNNKPRQRNKEKTIDQIIKVTLDLIDEGGYDKLSTNHIAERAQIAIGTVYHHFPKGKPDIVRKITLDSFQKVINFNIFNNISDSNFDETLNQIIRNHIETHQKHFAFNKAIEQAFLSNKKIFHDYISSIDKETMEFAGKLKKLSIFRKLSQEKLFINLKLSYILLESVVHYHLYFIPVFENDNDLVDYLFKLIKLTLLRD